MPFLSKIPILGWFVICPAVFVMGCGSATLALFNRKRVVVQPAKTTLEEKLEAIEVAEVAERVVAA